MPTWYRLRLCKANANKRKSVAYYFVFFQLILFVFNNEWESSVIQFPMVPIFYPENNSALF